MYVDSSVHLHPQITQITLMHSSETESSSCRLRPAFCLLSLSVLLLCFVYDFDLLIVGSHECGPVNSVASTHFRAGMVID